MGLVHAGAGLLEALLALSPGGLARRPATAGPLLLASGRLLEALGGREELPTAGQLQALGPGAPSHSVSASVLFVGRRVKPLKPT